MALPRVQIPITVSRSDNGNAVSGASIQVNVAGTGVPATVYLASDPNDSNTVPNPLTTDANGGVGPDAYLQPGIYDFNSSGGGAPSVSVRLDLSSAIATSTWTVTGLAVDRTFNPTATTGTEVAQVLATLISDLKGKGTIT